jgi:hypothetical protein
MLVKEEMGASDQRSLQDAGQMQAQQVASVTAIRSPSRAGHVGRCGGWGIQRQPKTGYPLNGRICLQPTEINRTFN